MRRRTLTVFVAVQLAIPTALLALRLITGDIRAYGWGWQMFS